MATEYIRKFTETWMNGKENEYRKKKKKKFQFLNK